MVEELIVKVEVLGSIVADSLAVDTTVDQAGEDIIEPGSQGLIVPVVIMEVSADQLILSSSTSTEKKL